MLPEAGMFAARALSEAGHRPKDYTAEELAQVSAPDRPLMYFRRISPPLSGLLDIRVALSSGASRASLGFA